jgi:uncharacterized RDD family membrane protein YckC
MTPDSPVDVQRAAVLPRVGGIALDWVLCMLISSWLFPSPNYENVSGLERILAGQPLATLGLWALQHFALVALLGMTYGHRLFGLRVIREDGARFPGFKAAGIRTVLLALVIPAVVWDSEGRGLHDRAAGTRLVKVR